MNVAELTLRFGATRLHASVHWPRTDSGRLALALADELTPADPLAPAPADDLTRPIRSSATRSWWRSTGATATGR